MVVEIKEYTSAEQLAERLDKEIGDTKSTLGEYLRRLDEIRTLAEKSKKIREVVLKDPRLNGLQELDVNQMGAKWLKTWFR